VLDKQRIEAHAACPVGICQEISDLQDFKIAGLLRLLNFAEQAEKFALH